MPPPGLTRRDLLGAAPGVGMAAYAATQGAAAEQVAGTEEDTTMSSQQPQATPTASGPPNILYFQVDNLGYGELGCYGGGILRGAQTARIDSFAKEGLQLLNFAPEAQCTPSRSALMTGRHAIRSGTASVQLAGTPGGLVAWERTMGDILSEAGYATACYGKWHLGDTPGRFPTDHGFDEWYGPPRTYDECLWPEDPFYNPQRDSMVFMLEGRKGEVITKGAQLTLEVRRDVDRESLNRAETFIQGSVDADTPFYCYFNHSLLHLPTVPREEFKGQSGAGDWADCLLELDADFGELLDLLDELGIAGNTIVVFAGDNGNEEALPWRGTAGYFEGSYFTGMEGSLRTPSLIRWPGQVTPGRVSNEIVHIADMFPTLLTWAGADVPADRVIDGLDQGAFFRGEQEQSAREGFMFWNGERLYGVKWQNFKMVMVQQPYFFDAAPAYGSPHIINLLADPKEREPMDYPYLHSWVGLHFGRIMGAFQESVTREPPIPPGAPLDFVPVR